MNRNTSFKNILIFVEPSVNFIVIMEKNGRKRIHLKNGKDYDFEIYIPPKFPYLITYTWTEILKWSIPIPYLIGCGIV